MLVIFKSNSSDSFFYIRARQRNGVHLEVEDVTECAIDQRGLESFIIEVITGGYLRKDALEKLLEVFVAYFENV